MMSGGTEQPVRVFHACTKGLEDRLLFMDESDYICATRIAAVTAYRHQVKIAAYCLMTNHVHFMVCADEKKCVSDFMTDFKKDYSRHYMRRYNSSKVLKRIEVTVKEMEDISYIRNCVSYILRNPVDGGLVKDTGQYRWSSVACYYSRNRNSDGMPASFFNGRLARKVFHTHTDLSKSGFAVDDDYNIIPSSFVCTGFVESLFRNSQEFFWNRLSKVDSDKMEFELVFSGYVKYNDYELVHRIEAVIKEKLKKSSVMQLEIGERIRLAGYLHRRMHAGIPQISRLLGLERKTVRKILGCP